VLDVLAAALLEHDAVDAAAAQQIPERQAGNACADDGDGGFHLDVAW
jgi:hypothetical protein